MSKEKDMLDILPNDEKLLQRHSVWCNFLKFSSEMAEDEDETDGIHIDNLQSYFKNENTEETDSEDEQDFVSHISEDSDTDQIPKAQLQLAINKRVNNWKKNGVNVSMMNNFDIPNDTGNFFGYKLNNTTVQQSSRRQFSICNETANNSKQNQDITKTKLIVTVEEFSSYSSSASSTTSMMDSILTHPFFNMSKAFRREDSHKMLSPLLSSGQNTFKRKLPVTKTKTIPSSQRYPTQITKCLPKLKPHQSDLFVFKKPEKPLPIKKIKNDKIANDNADNKEIAAANKNIICNEKLYKNAIVQLERVKIPKIIDSNTLKKSSDNCDEKLKQKVMVQLERVKIPQSIDGNTLKKSSDNKQKIIEPPLKNEFKINKKSSNSTNNQQCNTEKILQNNHNIGEHKKKVTFDHSVQQTTSDHKIYPKSPAKSKTIQELIHKFNQMDIESKYNSKIVDRKIKSTKSTKINTDKKDYKMDIESKSNKNMETKNVTKINTVTNETNEKQNIKSHIKKDDKNGLTTKIKSNSVDNGVNKETRTIQNSRSKSKKNNEPMDDGKKHIKIPEKVCDSNVQSKLSNTKTKSMELTKSSNDKPTKFLNANKLTEDTNSVSKSTSTTSAYSKSKSSSKFRNEPHVSANKNEISIKSTHQSKHRKLTENNKPSKVDSLQNTILTSASLIPSTSIINSTAIQSDHTMMMNKKQFSGNCKNINQVQSQAPALIKYVQNDNYAPIIIYSPTKSLKNKIVDENNKIVITKDDIESTIGTKYMRQYFGKYEPKIRCNASNQLIFFPPKPIEIDTNETSVDPLFPVDNRGRIIEKKRKL